MNSVISKKTESIIFLLNCDSIYGVISIGTDND